VVTVLGRRRTRGTRSATPSPNADELAVYAAETIVGRAWADQLLRYFDRMDSAFNEARLQCEAAAGCVVVAQRDGDPGEISLAHAALERALDACRASEAAREQGRHALQAALEALVRMDGDRAGSAQEPSPPNAEPTSAAPRALTTRPSIRLALPVAGAPQAVRRALWRFGRLRVRRNSGPAQP
jgi:hypothetical protein